MIVFLIYIALFQTIITCSATLTPDILLRTSRSGLRMRGKGRLSSAEYGVSADQNNKKKKKKSVFKIIGRFQTGIGFT